MDRQVLILQGVSGSGKSTFARDVEQRLERRTMVTVCSADSYFEQDGQYRFDVAKLGDAHATCFRDFCDNLSWGTNLVVVDNTNTTTMEIAPYMLAVAAANLSLPAGYKYTARIVRFACDDLEAAAQRNAHGVPLRGIVGQAQRIEAFDEQNYLGWEVCTDPSSAIVWPE